MAFEDWLEDPEYEVTAALDDGFVVLLDLDVTVGMLDEGLLETAGERLLTVEYADGEDTAVPLLSALETVKLYVGFKTLEEGRPDMLE